jgi:RNA recognition motif-containing protein
MNDDSQAQQAIEKLNGSEFMGRNLVVNEAKTRTENA